MALNLLISLRQLVRSSDCPAEKPASITAVLVVSNPITVSSDEFSFLSDGNATGKKKMPGSWICFPFTSRVFSLLGYHKQKKHTR